MKIKIKYKKYFSLDIGQDLVYSHSGKWVASEALKYRVREGTRH